MWCGAMTHFDGEDTNFSTIKMNKVSNQNEMNTLKTMKIIIQFSANDETKIFSIKQLFSIIFSLSHPLYASTMAVSPRNHEYFSNGSILPRFYIKKTARSFLSFIVFWIIEKEEKKTTSQFHWHWSIHEYIHLVLVHSDNESLLNLNKN